MHSERCSGGSFVAGILVGGLVGAGIALLFAPRSGAETRQRIREMGEDLKDTASDYVHKAGDSIHGAYDRSREYVSEHKSAITTAVEAGVDAYKKELEKAKAEQKA